MAEILRINADNLPERDSINLFDHVFTVRRVTRPVQKALEATDRKLRQLDEDTDGDQLVALMADGLDALLEPNGKGTPAKKLLLDSWKAGTLSLDQLNMLYESVQESGAKRPPTSKSAT